MSSLQYVHSRLYTAIPLHLPTTTGRRWFLVRKDSNVLVWYGDNCEMYKLCSNLVFIILYILLDDEGSINANHSCVNISFSFWLQALISHYAPNAILSNSRAGSCVNKIRLTKKNALDMSIYRGPKLWIEHKLTDFKNATLG